MIKFILLLFCIIISSTNTFSQNKLPVFNANSKVVDILDGNDFQKGNWNISPDVILDVFHVSRCKKNKIVTFYTDIDTITFLVKPDSTYDFIILLNGKDSAHTQISAVSEPIIQYKKIQKNKYINDTIHFTLGWSNTIHFKGRINNSDDLDFIFDTGANGIVLSSSAINKSFKVKNDGDIQSNGLGGTSMAQLSKINTLEIAGLKWDSISLIVKSEGKPDADAVIGYNVFDGKIVEINYDENIIVIHNQLPKNISSFSKLEMKFSGGLSFIEASLDNGIKKCKGWFDFDTGSDGTLFISAEFANQNQLYGSMKNIGTDKLQGSGPDRVSIESVKLPFLYINNFSLSSIPIDIENSTSHNGPNFNIIGNDVLKRFNLIIDYKNDILYLKPNSLINSFYKKNIISNVIFFGIIVLVMLLIVIIIMIARNRSRKNKNKMFYRRL
jgi:hypothetical protein